MEDDANPSASTLSDNLRHLEDAARLLQEAYNSPNPQPISSAFPKRIANILSALSNIDSRDNAERLLAAGVCMWNAVLSFESRHPANNPEGALAQLRHIATDCMYMAHTVLGGISCRYSIDALSLLKFYTACAQKYVSDNADMDLADVCFTRAAGFVDQVQQDYPSDSADNVVIARAMFDLLIGRAECTWDKGDTDKAQTFVAEARKYLDHLPGEHEFLASVEYNFGLFMHQEKKTDRALNWLQRSIETRKQSANPTMNHSKQARSIRLAGVCLLSLQEYDNSWNMMKEAEDINHDPVGAYLMLKLAIITKQPNAVQLMITAITDQNTTLDLAMASVALFTDGHQISEAAIGYKHLFDRFKEEPYAIVCAVGPRYFETLTVLEKVEDALQVLETCVASIPKLSTASTIEQSPDMTKRESQSMDTHFARWSSHLLSAGSAQADRKMFSSAATFLNQAVILARRASAIVKQQGNSQTSGDEQCSPPSNIVLENEAAVCRLLSSCALCSLDEPVDTKLGVDEVDKGENDGKEVDNLREKMITFAVGYAERAKVLDSSDFSPRLLLFRAYLVSGDEEKAAMELRKASSELRTFDISALCEAACAARDVGSTASVIAALRCILGADVSELSKPSNVGGPSLSKGLYGSVLITCVKLLIRDMESGDEGKEGVMEEEMNEVKVRDLLEVLKMGLRGVESVGVEMSFGDGNDEANVKSGLEFLANVAWNYARLAGLQEKSELWESLGDTSFKICGLLPDNEEMRTMRVMCRLMCASSIVDDEDSKGEDLVRAVEYLCEAKTIGQNYEGESRIDGLMVLLEGRCYLRQEDADGMQRLVELVLGEKKMSVTITTLEELGAICSRLSDKIRRTDMTVALLERAVDMRLREEKVDMGQVAVTLRELVSVELGRGVQGGRALEVFQRAVAVVMEHSEEFPLVERRWLVSCGWDRAQLLSQVAMRSEAKQWAMASSHLLEGCVMLSSYQPRLKALISTLATVVVQSD